MGYGGIFGAKAEGLKEYTATISTNWQEDSNTGVKSQRVPLADVTSANTAFVDHVFQDGVGYETYVEAENQFIKYILNGYAETYDGGVAFYIFGDAPTVEIPIIVGVA